MKKNLILRLSYLLLLTTLGFAPTRPQEVTGAWQMVAHRVSPAQDGITDLYGHFKDLYGGCQRDMVVTLNTDKTMTVTPAGGCQNPLGNAIMKVASRFMPKGDVTWEVTGDKIVLQDKKGKRQEYTLQQSGSDMQWIFDETSGQKTVRHTVEFKRN